MKTGNEIRTQRRDTKAQRKENTPSASPRLRVQTKGMWWLFVLGTAVLFLAACGGGQNLEEPPDIRYGEDVCEECSMIINEPRHAASYVLADGTVRRFDDLGEMLAYDSKHHEEVHVYWVHDFNTEEWIMAQKAAFVLNSEAKTPMGWGLLAFADTASADAYMAENGGTATVWSDLQTAVAAGELNPGERSAHNHPHDDMNHEGMDQDSMDHHQDAGG